MNFQYLHLALTILGWGIGIGMLRGTLSSHNDRLKALEDCEKVRAKEYVPREQLDLKFELMLTKLDHLKSLVEGYLGHRKTPEGERNKP